MYSLKDKEGTIINNVREDFFKEYDCRKLIGNIDFSVAIPQTGKELFPEIEYLLWAEAKKGALTPSAFHDAFIQLIFTIGRERTFDKNLPPKFLGAFDAEKIAFIPFSAVMEVFSQNDFNWNVAASDHESKEFKQLKEMVKKQLTETGKENENVYFFHFFNDKKDLQRFIKKNFVSGRDSVQRMRINQNNFTHIYEKWRREVMKTIDVKWDSAKKNGLMDHDFYLADLISSDNTTLKKGLKVLLQSDHYDLKERLSDEDLYRNGVFQIGFTDHMQAHSAFWSKYARPPKKEYWDKIIERKDLLVPQDIREIKGSYYTPHIWVEKSQEYLAEVLGKDWQDEYYIWDCCAGTGNLLAGLSNKHHIWASELFDSSVRVMHDRIEEKGEHSFLLKSHVFQFDFLNDDFSKLPQSLQDVINDEEKRKRLVIYINPPYKEASNATTVTGNGENQTDVAKKNNTYNKYLPVLGKAAREVYIQFLVRIYKELNGVTIGNFATLKGLQASNFDTFRNLFVAKLESLFLTPSYTFDNVDGRFPIGFHIWRTSVQERFSECMADVYNDKGEYIQKKKIFVEEGRNLNTWLKQYVEKKPKEIAAMCCKGTDFQNAKYVNIDHSKTLSGVGNAKGITKFIITPNNLTPAAIYFTARLLVGATWLNNRDQFLYPNEGWQYDKDFQSDCLVYTLFHGKNNLSSDNGINHWIPFTPQEVDAPDNFTSSFMSDFIAGKLAQKTLFDEGTDNVSLIPSEPIVFTPAAAAVMDAGRKLWFYYLHHKTNTYGADPINVNASFYDIRAYFQGFENGKMRNKSDDEKYNELLRDLRTYQKVLAKQIEKKVYLYGFLKGEAEVDPSERLHELERQNEELRHQLHAQQAAHLSVHIDHLDTLNLGDNVENKFTK